MKKISILFTSFLFLLPITTFASVLYSQTISLSPGWNIVSTPRILESHTFSVPETSNNFDIYVLNASSTSGWSTLASIGQTEFTPLFGYFVNNKSTSTQTLVLNYAASTTPNQRLFERTFTKTGWYSIGVANPTYAKKVTDNRTDINNPSSVLNSLSGSYESVLDLTDDSFAQDSNSVAVGNTWKQGISSDINSLNDFRESKGYVMYVNQTNSLYSGFQNNDTPQTPASTTVSVINDSAFTTNTITGGATNIPVGQYKITASGEDVKVNTLQVTFATTTISTLSNVSLYVDGGQVGTSQNFIGQPLNYNLGSSFIIPLDGTLTLTVKADIVNATNTTAYTTGTISTIIGGISNNAQGVRTTELVSAASSTVTSNTLIISSGIGTLTKTAGFVASNISPNTANVKIGSFTIQASDVEDAKVNSIAVNPNVSGYLVSNITNLMVKDGSTILGTPIGNPTSGTSTFSFSDITISVNSTKTFDVYADVGSDSTGSTTASMSISYRGVISNTSRTLSASGVSITSVITSLSSSTLVSSSAVSQFIVGGSTFGIATYKIKTVTDGTNATVRELHFSTTGTDAVTSVTVGGVTAAVVGGNTTVSGLNLAVSSTGTDIPVIVHYSGFLNSTSGGTLTQSLDSNVTLTYVEAVTSSGSVITETTSVPSNTMTLVASKPTVTLSQTTTSGFSNGSVKIGEFTISSDANGKIAVAQIPVVVSINGSGIITSNSIELRDSSGSTLIDGSNTLSASGNFILSTPRELLAGVSETYSVYATFSGVSGPAGTQSVTFGLGGSTSFLWNDVLGNTSNISGGKILNYPSGSQTKTN